MDIDNYAPSPLKPGRYKRAYEKIGGGDEGPTHELSMGGEGSITSRPPLSGVPAAGSRTLQRELQSDWLLTGIHMSAQSNPVPVSQGNTANRRWIAWLVGLTSVFVVLGVALAALISQKLWGYRFWRPGAVREITQATALTHLTILDPSDDKDCNFAKPALGARASVSMIRRDDNFQNEARLLATLEARGLSVSVTSPDAGLDGSALYQQLIEANRLKPVSKEKPCLWGVATASGFWVASGIHPPKV